ncbi:MAG: arginase family protein [Deltaproteobacteria bacterium]|nr:arginase family protein [Deltaproteobacteria bacterium]
MKINLILVPYHLGRENDDMGKGPLRYLQAGADKKLASLKNEVDIKKIRSASHSKEILDAIARVSLPLAQNVKKTIREGKLPFVLAGNCNVCLGMLGGLDTTKTGIIWFDAHGDINTPETTLSNYFDGMPLAIAHGRCYKSLRKKIGIEPPLPEAHTLMVGLRDLDPGETKHLKTSPITTIPAEKIKKLGVVRAMEAKIKKFSKHVKSVYLHIDVDVMDLKEAPAVNFPCPGGLTMKEMTEAILLIAKNFHITAVALTNYNPEKEIHNKTLKTGLKLMTTIAKILQSV